MPERTVLLADGKHKWRYLLRELSGPVPANTVPAKFAMYEQQQPQRTVPEQCMLYTSIDIDEQPVLPKLPAGVSSNVLSADVTMCKQQQPQCAVPEQCVLHAFNDVKQQRLL